jgi:hypothetical protein
VNAEHACYTDSRVKFVRRGLLRALLCCAASGAGVFGTSPLTGFAAFQAVNEGVPPLVWWRSGAQPGIAAAEAFANSFSSGHQ